MEETAERTIEILWPYLSNTYVRNLIYDKRWEKKFSKMPYLERFIENKPFPPFEVEIQVSSNCNLNCAWCIAKEIKNNPSVLRLPDYLNIQNIQKIVDDILNFQIGGLKVEIIKFSGFSGEPLLHKETTLNAMQRLNGAGRAVGLFTNGILMDEETWDTLANIYYINISLDAGPYTFNLLKYRGKKIFKNNFQQIIENIKGLDKVRKQRESRMQLGISYVIVPDNYWEIYETTRLVKEAGADSIRFKCDIGGNMDLSNDKNILDKAFECLEKTKNDFGSDDFSVTVIHSKKDVEKKTYKQWNTAAGCNYHNFLATIGSNGELYLCDHNTMPGAVSFGSVINEPFNLIWFGSRRGYMTQGVKYLCNSPVCPPFGNAINFFLDKLKSLAYEFGSEEVIIALRIIRERLEAEAINT
jgi:sulfatase maturation enzyme AslB (radical SAM superfamily)